LSRTSPAQGPPPPSTRSSGAVNLLHGDVVPLWVTNRPRYTHHRRTWDGAEYVGEEHIFSDTRRWRAFGSLPTHLAADRFGVHHQHHQGLSGVGGEVVGHGEHGGVVR